MDYEDQDAIQIEKSREFAAKTREGFIVLEDGYNYYCPLHGKGLTSENLREIADLLDKTNEEWHRGFGEINGN